MEMILRTLALRTKSCQGHLPLTLQGFGHSPERSGFGDTLHFSSGTWSSNIHPLGVP
uniref:Uncharacterized protein n=1 Tax=Timema cristinae TaxID=61476 RepID=A0A7R9HE44_TIMCR|nr:unnamed protein product [Timema cristinae]